MLLLLAGFTARARSIEDIRRIFGAPPPGSISAEYRILLMRVDAYALPRLRSNSTPPKSQPRLRYNEKQVGAHRLATGSTVRRMLRLQMSTRGTWRCHANNSILSRASILVHRPERRSEWLRQSHFSTSCSIGQSSSDQHVPPPPTSHAEQYPDEDESRVTSRRYRCAHQPTQGRLQHVQQQIATRVATPEGPYTRRPEWTRRTPLGHAEASRERH
jgi:hypothetical protein